MIVYYLLTENCNLKCIHCIRGDKSDSLSANYNIVIDKLNDYYGKFCLVITGGEPTLSPHFKNVINYSLNSGVHEVLVVSNGAYNNAIKLFSDYSERDNFYVQFSIDGNEYHHDIMRGKGNYRKTINTIEQLKSIGIKSFVSSVCTESNLNSFFDLSEVLVKLDIKKWHINPVLPFGDAAFQVKPIDVETWNIFVDRIKTTYSGRLSIHKLYDFSVLDKLSNNELDKYIDKLKNTSNCMSGKNKIYIYPDGTVYGCTCLKDYPFGNIYTDELATIMNTQNALDIVNYKLKEDSHCNSCRYVKLCNGGCIGMSQNYFGKIGYGDIRCPILKGKI